MVVAAVGGGVARVVDPAIRGPETLRRRVVHDLLVCIGVVPAEAHVPRPVPVRPGVRLAAGACPSGKTAGHLVVPDDVLAVDGDGVLPGEVGGEPGRGAVHRARKPRRIGDVPFVLDTDAVLVGLPPPGVPGNVLLAHRLSDKAVGGPHDVVGRGACVVFAGEPVYGARPAALGHVDDDGVYVVGGLG